MYCYALILGIFIKRGYFTKNFTKPTPQTAHSSIGIFITRHIFLKLLCSSKDVRLRNFDKTHYGYLHSLTLIQQLSKICLQSYFHMKIANDVLSLVPDKSWNNRFYPDFSVTTDKVEKLKNDSFHPNCHIEQGYELSYQASI